LPKQKCNNDVGIQTWVAWRWHVETQQHTWHSLQSVKSLKSNHSTPSDFQIHSFGLAACPSFLLTPHFGCHDDDGKFNSPPKFKRFTPRTGNTTDDSAVEPQVLRPNEISVAV